MGKLSNMLEILLILHKREKVKARELANRFGLSEKQIRRYINEIDLSGIAITSSVGRYGGYSLFNKELILPLKDEISDEEKLLIKLISSDNGISISEMYSSLEIYFKDETINHLISSNESSNDIKTLIKIHTAIKDKKIIEIEYIHTNKKCIKKTIHPYFTFKKYNTWYLVAYDNYHKTCIKLKIKRFINIKSLNESYRINQDLYDSEKSIIKTNVGVYNTGEEYFIRLKLSKSLSWAIDDYLEGEITTLNESDKYITIEFKTSNLNEIKRQILYLGSKCTVESPKELIAIISNEANLILAHYQN